MTSRAQRNNNPGNIRVGGHWRGLQPPELMTPEQEAEHAFCVFSSPSFGFRALTLLLLTYEQDGFETIDQIIGRWAPPSDHNNTPAYIVYVASHTTFSPSAVLNLKDYSTMRKLVAAIGEREGGGRWWLDQSLDEGLRFAGLRLLQ